MLPICLHMSWLIKTGINLPLPFAAGRPEFLRGQPPSRRPYFSRFSLGNNILVIITAHTLNPKFMVLYSLLKEVTFMLEFN